MTKKNTNHTILVVDDEPEIRGLIADFLGDDEGYTVLTANDGLDALENILPNNKVDLIISDINMPRMKGFDLLNHVRESYPHIKRVLITAYNVEDYFELALKHDVGNIFVKTTPFNFKELSTILVNLITSDIFGAERYMGPNFITKEFTINRGDTLEDSACEIIKSLPPLKEIKRLELVLVELFTNAIFYGIRKEKPDRKETWVHDFELSQEEAIQVKVLHDEKKYAISITDGGGRLKKQDVLYWLHRQISKDKNGLPLGIMDSHGRGFFIARKYIDRLLININKNIRTEVIIINYYKDLYCGFKPLYINEI